MFILQLLVEYKRSPAETLSEIDALCTDACIVSERTLVHLLSLIEQTRIKLVLFFQQYTDRYRAPPDLSSYNAEDVCNFLMDFPKPQVECPHCAAYYLSVDYYIRNGSYIKNARFLFGTASQFCI